MPCLSSSLAPWLCFGACKDKTNYLFIVPVLLLLTNLYAAIKQFTTHVTFIELIHMY